MEPTEVDFSRFVVAWISDSILLGLILGGLGFVVAWIVLRRRGVVEAASRALRATSKGILALIVMVAVFNGMYLNSSAEDKVTYGLLVWLIGLMVMAGSIFLSLSQKDS